MKQAGILVSQTGIEPAAPAVEAQSLPQDHLVHWATSACGLYNLLLIFPSCPQRTYNLPKEKSYLHKNKSCPKRAMTMNSKW